MGLLKKKKASDNNSEKKVKEKNWYTDRYESVLLQRNFLLFVIVVSVIGIAASVMAVITISSSKTIEPFVIEVEKKTGITNVIRPLLKEKFAYDETLRRYFITKYMNARETYDMHSFEHQYFTVVRLLSASRVYGSFRNQVYVDNPNSPIRLGKKKRFITIKSITFLQTRRGETGFTAQIRFTRWDEFAKKNAQHFIATMTFDYQDLSLTTDERAINPLGFQVLSYRTDKETVKY